MRCTEPGKRCKSLQELLSNRLSYEQSAPENVRLELILWRGPLVAVLASNHKKCKFVTTDGLFPNSDRGGGSPHERGWPADEADPGEILAGGNASNSVPKEGMLKTVAGDNSVSD